MACRSELWIWCPRSQMIPYVRVTQPRVSLKAVPNVILVMYSIYRGMVQKIILGHTMMKFALKRGYTFDVTDIEQTL